MRGGRESPGHRSHDDGRHLSLSDHIWINCWVGMLKRTRQADYLPIPNREGNYGGVLVAKVCAIEGNPIMNWLTTQGLTLREFSILADVGYNDAYMVVRGYYKALPQRYRAAITERAGNGAGETMAQDYAAWRHGLRALIPSSNVKPSAR